MNTELVHEIMASLVDTVRERKPDAVHRMVPASGWYTLDGDFPVETPTVAIVPIEALEPMTAYTRVEDGGRIVWRLVREPKVLWYYLNQLELEENDTVVYRYYALSLNRLATLLLEQLGQQPQQHDG